MTQKLLSYTLLPVTFAYCILTKLKKLISKPKDFDIPIISIGNLVVGGSGKTPVTIELAKRFDKTAIILRGYKRKSKGLQIVSLWGDVKVGIDTSGDEAMLLASSLPNSTVIVSEDRKKAIKKAKSLGAKLIFLDDGFSKFDIKKFDILLKPKENYPSLCLPSGPYRFSPSNYKNANLVMIEDIDYKRKVTIKNPTSNMILLTAISKPQRLEKYLPKNIKKIYLPDHSNFSKEYINSIMIEYEPTSILTTSKDEVKLKQFEIPLSLLELNIEINNDIIEIVSKELS